MTPIQYVRAFARFWWLIAICVVLGAALALALNGAFAPPYTSTSRVLVSTTSSASTNPSDAYQGTLLAQQRVLSYAEIARGPAVTKTLIEDLGLRSTSDELSTHIRVAVPANTAVLDISVDDASSAQAKRVATDAANVVAKLINAQESVRGTGTPLLRARAIGEATTPTASAARRNVALGGAGGLLVGLILAVAASRLDRRLRDDDEVTQASGSEVTGVVPLRRRRPRLRRAHALASRADAIRELRTSLYFRHPGPEHSLTVSMTSVEPLDDLPELAADLAAALADTGAHVLLIEADLHDPRQAVLLDLGDGAGLATFLDGTRAEHDVIRHRTGHGFDVVPAGSTVANPADLLHSHAFAEVVEDGARHYDFVLVTAPALSLGTDALAVAARSDMTLVSVVLGRTRRSELGVAFAQLRGVDARDVRTVLFD